MIAGTLPPHEGMPVATAGLPLAAARAALVLVHGRGATADGILELADDLGHEGFAYLAPQAEDGTWYPLRFLAPFEDNEPELSSSLALLADLLAQVEAAGVPPERTVLAGFSQGACLALEYAARNARRYGGVVAFSGALMGDAGEPREDSGAFAGTPIFLGCSDRDPHIPRDRVAASAALLERQGARVTERIYRGLGHTLNDDEMEHARAMLAAVLGG